MCEECGKLEESSNNMHVLMGGLAHMAEMQAIEEGAEPVVLIKELDKDKT